MATTVILHVHRNICNIILDVQLKHVLVLIIVALECSYTMLVSSKHVKRLTPFTLSGW